MKRLKPALVNSSPSFNCLVKSRIRGFFCCSPMGLTLWGPGVQLFLSRRLMSSYRGLSLPFTTRQRLCSTRPRPLRPAQLRPWAAAGAATTAPSPPPPRGISAAGAGLRLSPSLTPGPSRFSTRFSVPRRIEEPRSGGPRRGKPG